MATKQQSVERVRPSGLSDRTLALLLVIPAAVLLLVFSVYPFLQAFWDGFYRIPLASQVGTFIGFDNYRALIHNSEVRNAAWRTVIWTVSNVVIQAGLGLIISLVLNAKLRGQTVARGLVLFPYMVPAVVVAAVFRFSFNDITGIANYLWLKIPGTHPLLFLSSPNSALITVIIVNCWKYTPFMVIVLLARLQSVPADLYESARLDGAGPWQTFRDVTLPWLRPVLLIAILLRAIWVANDFDLIYLLAFGGPLNATTTLPVEIRHLAFDQQDFGSASALAILVAIVIAIASFGFLYLYHRSEAQLE